MHTGKQCEDTAVVRESTEGHCYQPRRVPSLEAPLIADLQPLDLREECLLLRCLPKASSLEYHHWG